MLAGGRKVHLAIIDMLNMDLINEFQVRETVCDVAFLQNEQLFAIAQKKYSSIYNRHGTEIHCLKIYRDTGDQDHSVYMTHRIVKGIRLGRFCSALMRISWGLGTPWVFLPILLNFDTSVANPFETKKQPETIMLNLNMIGAVKSPKKKEKKTKKEIEKEMEDAVDAAKNTKCKKKTKGRSKPSKRAKRKQDEVFKAKRPFLEQHREEDGRPNKKQLIADEAELPIALQRFAKKRPS